MLVPDENYISFLNVFVLPLDKYPTDAESYAVIANYLYTSVYEEYKEKNLQKDLDCSSITFYITKEVQDVEEIVQFSKDLRKSEGLIVLSTDVQVDATFYLASLFKADMIVRVFEKETLPGALVIGIYSRLFGLNAICCYEGKTEFELAPLSLISHMLPTSIISHKLASSGN